MSNTELPLVRPLAGAKKFITACYELADVLLLAVMTITVMFMFVVRFAGVVGSSMVPTLHDRDWLAVTATLPHPKPGQIVIISPRTNAFHEPLVKRVIALGGDEVDLRDGKVYVNGQLRDEPYLPEGTVTEPADWYASDMTYPVKVPMGKVFVMGDNRSGSSDSRFAAVGFIQADDILGRVCFRLHPFYTKDPTFHFTMKVE